MPVHRGWPPNDEHFLFTACRIERRGERPHHDKAGYVVARIGRDCEVNTLRQRPPQRFAGLAPHNDMMSACEFAKAFQIGWQMPG